MDLYFTVYCSFKQMRAIKDLWFFVAVLNKPIHADLQLINFVGRKGHVCIFAILKKPYLPFHLKL